MLYLYLTKNNTAHVVIDLIYRSENQFFSKVCKDNDDLKEIFSNFFQFKPFKEEDIVRLSTKVGLSDRKTYQVVDEIKSQFGDEAVKYNSAKALLNIQKKFQNSDVY